MQDYSSLPLPERPSELVGFLKMFYEGLRNCGIQLSPQSDYSRNRCQNHYMDMLALIEKNRHTVENASLVIAYWRGYGVALNHAGIDVPVV